MWSPVISSPSYMTSDMGQMHHGGKYVCVFFKLFISPLRTSCTRKNGSKIPFMPWSSSMPWPTENNICRHNLKKYSVPTGLLQHTFTSKSKLTNENQKKLNLPYKWITYLPVVNHNLLPLFPLLCACGWKRMDEALYICLTGNLLAWSSMHIWQGENEQDFTCVCLKQL